MEEWFSGKYNLPVFRYTVGKKSDLLFLFLFSPPGSNGPNMAQPPARSRFGAELEIPGPGTYNYATDQTSSGFMGDAPRYTIASRKVQTKPDDASPGPIYSPRMDSALEQSPQFSFGNSKRFEAGGTFPPGPGQYESLSTRFGGSLVGDAPKYGFGTSVQRPSSEHKKGQR